MGMPHDLKAILTQGNAAVSRGDYDAFLAHCTEDTRWTFVGEQTLVGKAAVRAYMQQTYRRPPEFTTTDLIQEGDMLIAIGEITLFDAAGKPARYAYSDAWRFRGPLIHELRAYVVAI